MSITRAGRGSPNALQTTATVAGQLYQQVTGFAPAAIYYTAAPGGYYFDPATGSGITLVGSATGNDTFGIKTTLAGSTTVFLSTANAGGTATFNVDGRTFNPAGPQNGLLGTLVLQGGSSNDYYNVTLSGGGDVFIQDQGVAGGNHAATITSPTPQAPFRMLPNLFLQSGEVIGWNGNLQSVDLTNVRLSPVYGGTPAGTAAPSNGTVTELDASTLANPPGVPKVLDLDLSNLPNNLLHITGVGQATLTVPGSTAYKPLAYTGFDEVTATGGLLNVLLDNNSSDMTPAPVTQWTVRMVGSLVQLSMNGTVLFVGDSAALGSITVQGLGGDNVLTVDNTGGLVTTPINFIGGPSGHHALVILGGGQETYSPSATDPNSGRITVVSGGRTQTINFTNSQDPTPMSLYFFNQTQAIISLPSNTDVLTVDSPTLASLSQADQNALTGAGLTDGSFNRLSGTIGGLPFTDFFGNDKEVDLVFMDNANPNTPTSNSVTIQSLVAAQLEFFKVLGGAATNTMLTDTTTSYNLPVAGGGISFIGGIGTVTNQIVANAPVTQYTLTNFGLTSSGTPMPAAPAWAPPPSP